MNDIQTIGKLKCVAIEMRGGAVSAAEGNAPLTDMLMKCGSYS